MAVEIAIPGGTSRRKVTVVRWLQYHGAHVHAGEPIVELEDDKAVFEMVSPADGILRQLMVVGESAADGELIARID